MMRKLLPVICRWCCEASERWINLKMLVIPITETQSKQSPKALLISRIAEHLVFVLLGSYSLASPVRPQWAESVATSDRSIDFAVNFDHLTKILIRYPCKRKSIALIIMKCHGNAYALAAARAMK